MDTTTEIDQDRAILAAVAGGDHGALKRLYGRHSVRVFRFLMRITQNKASAEELMNEVFLDIWRHAGRYEGRSAPTTWMLAIAHNKAVSSLRKRRETTGLDDDAITAAPDLGDTPEATAQKADTGRIIAECLGRLSPDHREIVELVYYQERSVEEAAAILAIPANTVKTRMFYARKKLAELLKARGVERGWP